MNRTMFFVGALTLVGTTLSGCAALQGSDNLLGDPATAASASRTIVISPDEATVGVKHGDVVKFVSGDQSFAWNFDTAYDIRSFELNKVAPAGVLNHEVEVYIEPDPVYGGL